MQMNGVEKIELLSVPSQVKSHGVKLLKALSGFIFFESYFFKANFLYGHFIRRCLKDLL